MKILAEEGKTKAEKSWTMAELALEMYNQSARGDRHYPTEEIEVYYRPFIYTKQDKFWQLKHILRLVKILK